MARPFLPDHIFWNQVAISPFDEACWPWKGRCDPAGRGRCRFRKESDVPAYRAAYELEYGPIPEGLIVRHKCNNPRCCNPYHLRLGTQTENMADMWGAGRGKVPPPIFGEQAYHAKLTDAQVAEIRQLYNTVDKNGKLWTQQRLAYHFGIGQTQISRILRGESR